MFALGSTQMIINSRALALGWRPADPAVLTALAPAGARLPLDRQMVLMQYVVDTTIQTSGLGAHSATLLGFDLEGGGAPGSVPPRLWTHAIVSTPQAQTFFAARGVASELGRTTIVVRGEVVTATTEVGDEPVLRVTARVGSPTIVEAGDRTYVRPGPDGLVEETHPWIATMTDTWSLAGLELLDPTHRVAVAPPEDPAEATWGFYAPNASFCFPPVGAAAEPAPAPLVAADDPTRAWGGVWGGNSPLG